MESSVRILIVDKNSEQTELTMELIREVVQAEIDSTSSGERALQLIAITNYNLVIVDCNIGDIEGLSILERVKQLSPTTSVILTSAEPRIEEAVKAIRQGADEYCKKPFNMDDFKLSVKRCLSRRELFTKDVAVTGLMYLLNVCQLVSGCIEEKKVFEIVVGYLKREINPEGIALFKYADGEAKRVETNADFEPDVVEVLVSNQNFLNVCIDEKTPMKIIQRSGQSELAVFQFLLSEESPYFVVAVSPKWKISPENIDSYYRLLHAQILMTGRNIQNYKAVSDMMYLDEPTGLGNTRHMHYCLDQAFADRRKKKRPFSLLFMDIDKFKSINDTYGHLIGTRLLHEMGQIIKEAVRDSDHVFRYGGDEFVVLLHNCPTAKAIELGEKIRAQIEKHVFLEGEELNIKLTVSVGVANCPDHANSKREFIEAADNAMYVVKRRNRNSVVAATKKAA